MKQKYNEKQLIDVVSEFTKIDKKERTVDINDDLLLDSDKFELLMDLKNFRYKLQYTINGD